ncbi:hypothetical protein VOLCADRAFT_91235 [Volvox carteri f. nagariensis]|uniref:Uncharacterized protein n=1 Tax=Volvox carteri f. nagariensis TaxID=3068 RepID=D8TWJ0_VOLCA|nr:uncharacterized protein VOLCADRAFT_91235 [Volvox carteri f. nagariensis]EFJ48162.1 hypothetical protein VOLCADRAFT_91235 [Volvox carteri f. nagariensis]|eukprot:XP_002950847.1 hypothetical protein VOLCADRAFT_91235 [Volvox carteri f. nagariensis]
MSTKVDIFGTKRKRARLIREEGVRRSTTAANRDPQVPRRPQRQHSQPTTVGPTIAEEDIYQEDAPTDFSWIPDDHPHVGQADIELTAAADHGACDSDDYNEDSEDADESDGAGGAGTSYRLAFDPQLANLYFHHLPNSAVERAPSIRTKYALMTRCFAHDLIPILKARIQKSVSRSIVRLTQWSPPTMPLSPPSDAHRAPSIQTKYALMTRCFAHGLVPIIKTRMQKSASRSVVRLTQWSPPTMPSSPPSGAHRAPSIQTKYALMTRCFAHGLVLTIKARMQKSASRSVVRLTQWSPPTMPSSPPSLSHSVTGDESRTADCGHLCEELRVHHWCSCGPRPQVVSGSLNRARSCNAYSRVHVFLFFAASCSNTRFHV